MAAFVLSHVVFKNFESELLAGGQFNSITLRFFGLLYPDGRLFLSEGHEVASHNRSKKIILNNQ